MISTFTADLWSELKNFLNPTDREQAADIVVSMLIDADEDIEDIKKAFRNDELIKNSLLYYIDSDESLDDDEDDSDFDYDNE